MKDIKHDLVVMGATGFTGKLVVEYLIKSYGVRNQHFTWAIAGRSLSKLEKLKDSLKKLDSLSPDIPTIQVDSLDSKSLDTMTSSCRLVITTVGPYMKFGIQLVESCVKNSTHYCDLTGEVPFIRQSIDLFHSKAKENSCKIIHSCGFDSIPSDIGVLLLQQTSIKRNQKPCNKVKLYVKSIKGGLSGGTVASMISISQHKPGDPKEQKIFRGPFALNPREYSEYKTRQPSLKSIKWDKGINRWLSPFVMSGFNSKVVRRTNALLDHRYGKDFAYTEVSTYKKGLRGYFYALSMLITLVALQITLKSRILLWVIRKLFFPVPGQGPSREKRESGYFNLDIIGAIDNTKKTSIKVIGEGDPGYLATATMITEAGLSIIMDEERLPEKYGVLTPASGIGEVLAERLKDNGIQFNIME